VLALAAFDSFGSCEIDTRVIKRQNTRKPSNIRRMSMYFRRETARLLGVPPFNKPMDEEMESMCLSSFPSQSSEELDIAIMAGKKV
jgi:hypothetical protein